MAKHPHELQQRHTLTQRTVTCSPHMHPHTEMNSDITHMYCTYTCCSYTHKVFLDHMHTHDAHTEQHTRACTQHTLNCTLVSTCREGSIAVKSKDKQICPERSLTGQNSWEIKSLSGMVNWVVVLFLWSVFFCFCSGIWTPNISFNRSDWGRLWLIYISKQKE